VIWLSISVYSSYIVSTHKVNTESNKMLDREHYISLLLEWCSDFSRTMLEDLTMAELRDIDAVDTNWCTDEAARNEYSDTYVTEEMAVASALFAQYEEIIQFREAA